MLASGPVVPRILYGYSAINSCFGHFFETVEKVLVVKKLTKEWWAGRLSAMKILAMMAALIFSASAFAAEPFDKAAAVAAWREKSADFAKTRGPALESEIASLDKQLAQAQKGTIAKRLKSPTVRGDKGDYKFADQRAKLKEVGGLRGKLTKLQSELANLKSGAASKMPLPLKVGVIGELPGDSVIVSQVIGEKEVLADIVGTTKSPRQVGNVVRFDLDEWRKLVMFRGVDTSEMADDEPAELNGTYIVVGTTRYDTATGTNTVFVLEAVDPAN